MDRTCKPDKQRALAGIGMPGDVRLVAPQLSEHNEQALLEAAYTDQEIATLRERNVI